MDCHHSSLFFSPPLQTDVPSSGTCPALLAFYRNRKASNIFWHKFYGQPAVVIEVNFYYSEKKKSPTKILKQTYFEAPPAQQLPKLISISVGSDFPAAPSPYNRLEWSCALVPLKGTLLPTAHLKAHFYPWSQVAHRIVGKYPVMIRKTQFPCAQDPDNSHL